MMLPLALMAALSTASAGTLAGVTLPDSATVGGSPVVLNGLGLREKYFIDIYVGALYMPAPTRDASAAISADVPKRIVMHFLMDVPKAKLVATLKESLAKSPDAATAMASFGKFASWMDDMSEGDEAILDYTPGSGLTVTVGGTARGTIQGADFMRAIWGIYLGPTPASEQLKAGMMGQ